MRKFEVLVLLMACLKGSRSFSPCGQQRSSVIGHRNCPFHSLNDSNRLSTSLGYQKGRPSSSFMDTTTSIVEEKTEAPRRTVLKTAFVDESDSSSSIIALDAIADNDNVLEKFLGASFWGPRIFLAAVACIYGTNFALGAVLDQALPASAATCDRMVLAALALSPFVFQLESNLVLTTVLAGCFTAMGYVTQSLALVDTMPATVSFLGAATVLVCPALQALVDKKPMGWKDAPQTWIAAALCLMGVGVLELWDPTTGAVATSTEASVGTATMISFGHVLALLQAVGFGTGLFLSSKMVTENPRQALPITSVMIAVTAFVSMVWSFCDGWMQQPDWQSLVLPQVLWTDGNLWNIVGGAVLWTGLISTSLNFFLEVTALGHVSSAEASVILATEPLWAALFASILLGEGLDWNDGVGGLLIVSACLANTLSQEQVHNAVSVVFGKDEPETTKD